MAAEISIDNLIENSICNVLEYYKSDKVRAYSVGIQVHLPEYRNIEHDLLTNKTFHIHLDISKRWNSRSIDVVNLTPKMTEAGGFLMWLKDNFGNRFLAGYYKEIFRVIEEEHGEDRNRLSNANSF
ncbi:hypothetical protein [Bacillus atrophaeus]|uniref:hypothetical protein n=1 Tax=Bacillus atrophaeus TaxID=1452 RepID=UPI002E23CFE3|nr:hypothetical protein [Bacillus atrophaeus]